MVIGISAPPTRIAKTYPNNKPTVELIIRIAIIVDGSVILPIDTEKIVTAIITNTSIFKTTE